MGFRYAMISLVLFVIALVGITLSMRLDLEALSLVSGALILVVGVLALIGFIASLKGIKEKNTAKKIIGLIVNACFLIFIVGVFLVNVYDIYRAFN